jgi:hypothetical protein
MVATDNTTVTHETHDRRSCDACEHLRGEWQDRHQSLTTWGAAIRDLATTAGDQVRRETLLGLLDLIGFAVEQSGLDLQFNTSPELCGGGVPGPKRISLATRS